VESSLPTFAWNSDKARVGECDDSEFYEWERRPQVFAKRKLVSGNAQTILRRPVIAISREWFLLALMASGLRRHG